MSDSVIYTDSVHLVSADLKALHKFARKLGLKRQWFQDEDRYPHYDLTTIKMFHKALAHGAQECSSKDIIRLLKNSSTVGEGITGEDLSVLRRR